MEISTSTSSKGRQQTLTDRNISLVVFAIDILVVSIVVPALVIDSDPRRADSAHATPSPQTLSLRQQRCRFTGSFTLALRAIP